MMRRVLRRSTPLARSLPRVLLGGLAVLAALAALAASAPAATPPAATPPDAAPPAARPPIVPQSSIRGVMLGMTNGSFTGTTASTYCR